MPELHEVLTEEVIAENDTTSHQSTTKNTGEKKTKYNRPPIEQITEDIVDYLLTKSIGGNQIQKLGFSCGKILYGFKEENGEEFRVIAFKARKKSLSVEGKSRSMMFFGIENAKPLLKLYKDLPVSTSERGACSCQVKEPLYVTLDKVTFTENFGGSVSEVLNLLRNLVDITIDQKTEAWEEKQTKKPKELALA